MKTSKKVSLILLSFMLILMTSCGSNESISSSISGADNTESLEISESSEVASEPENSSYESMSVGQTLLNDFKTELEANPSISLEELADNILSDDIIQFEGVHTTVENGMLTGFGNAEITGFKDGVMFSPMISSVPFIGYIFKLDDSTNAEEFTKMLKDNADLRWNICTEADEIIVDYSGDTVFFLMCPKSFE